MRLFIQVVIIAVLSMEAVGHAGAGGEHSHKGHDDSVNEATIQLHRVANDPLMEDIEKAKELLAGGAVDIDYQHPRTGQTALMSASLGGKAKLIDLLLAHGANPKVPEMDGYTPVHGAGFQGRVDAMRSLVKAGLDFGDVHSDGYTPFHRACWGKNERHATLVAMMIDELNVDPSMPAHPPGSMSKTCRGMTTNKRTIKVLEDREALKKGAEPAKSGSSENEL